MEWKDSPYLHQAFLKYKWQWKYLPGFHSHQSSSSRWPDRACLIRIPIFFWVLPHHKSTKTGSLALISGALCQLPLSISFMPLSCLDSLSLNSFSYTACPVSFPQLCLLHGFLLSPADTGSLSALCSEWQRTQAAASLSQSLPPPSNLPTSQPAD